jgi:hypothetical protein
MADKHTIIHIHPQAPAKPLLGAACNGCGVCCLLEPCPVGVVLSRRRHGACAALRWDEVTQRYRCGALTQPVQVLQDALPRWLRWFLPAMAGGLKRWGPRWIAAGAGCDSNVEVAAKADEPTV